MFSRLLGGGVAVAQAEEGFSLGGRNCSALQVLHQSREGRSLGEAGRTGRLPGLGNMGNTCYMNAMLQCLLNTPGRLTEACKAFADLTPRGLSGRGLLGKRFAELVRQYDGQEGSYIPAWRGALKNMQGAVAELHPTFRCQRQEDAYEFLGFLLEGLEENFRLLLDARGAAARGGGDGDIVHSVCGVSTYTSRWCHSCLQVFQADRVVDTALRLPLLSPQAQIDEAIRATEEASPVAFEELMRTAQCCGEELERYECAECARRAAKAGTQFEPSAASQTSGLIAETRDILVVVLNRFMNVRDADGGYSPVKVRREVVIPTVMSLEAGEYRLYGVVSHSGQTLKSGHYVTAVKSLRDHQWYLCDDAKVTPLELHNLYEVGEVTKMHGSADPYVLFFHRFKQDMDVAE